MPVVLALPDLLLLAALLVAFGLIVFGDAFVRALFSALSFTTSWIPFVGDKIDAAIRKASQAISNKLGAAADGVGYAIARCWNFLAVIVDRTGWAVWHLALAVKRIHDYLTDPVWIAKTLLRTMPFVMAFRWIREHLKTVTNVTNVIHQSIVRPVSSPIGAAVRVVVRVDKAALHRLEKWTHAQVARIDHAVAHAGAIALPLPGTALGELEELYNRLRKRVARIEVGKVGYIAAGVFVATLARFGLGWLRCQNVKQLGRGVCRLDTSLLETILTDGIAIVGSVSIVSMAEALLEVQDEVSKTILRNVRETAKV